MVRGALRNLGVPDAFSPRLEREGKKVVERADQVKRGREI
jgi:hypothetical protein